MIDILKPKLLELQKEGIAIEKQINRLPKSHQKMQMYPEGLQIRYSTMVREVKDITDMIKHITEIYRTTAQ